MSKKILLFIAVVIMSGLFIPVSAKAAGIITNKANLAYSDPSGGTYTAVGSCSIRKIGTVNVTIAKSSRNIERRGTGTEYFGTETSIGGDIVEYRIILENTGEDTAVYVVLKDSLPGSVTYQAGSIRIGTRTLTDDQDADESNYSNGTITTGKDEGETTGNGAGITLDGGAKVEIYYWVRIK